MDGDSKEMKDQSMDGSVEEGDSSTDPNKEGGA